MEIRITGKGDQELARVTVTEMDVSPDGEYASYSVQVAVERGGAVGLHQRALHNFPCKKYNPLALAIQALNTLSEEELELEQDAGSSDMDRGFGGTLREIQERASGLYRD